MLKRVMLTTDAVGGVWQYCLELAHGFRERGAAVTLVAMGPSPNDTQRAAARNAAALIETALPLDWLAERAGDLAMAASELAGIARRIGAETIHLHTPALAAGADWPAPVIAMAHSCVGTWWRTVRGSMVLPPDLAWRVDLVARGLHAADGVIAPSRAFAAALRAVYGKDQMISVVPNGRRTAPLPRNPQPQALTAGRLWDEGKNIAMLDAAAGLVDFPVFAAGPVRGPNGTHVACRHLRLLGSLDEAALARQYARAAVFVSVARYEPFGLAVLEAAQAGAALVLSDIATFRELWDGAAVFVHPDDAEGLSTTLSRLLRNPARCVELGLAARRRGTEYDAGRMVDATWTVHCKAARAHAGRDA